MKKPYFLVHYIMGSQLVWGSQGKVIVIIYYLASEIVLFSLFINNC